MKCDKLNEKIQITNDTRMVYLKSEVDAAIAELKEVANDACLERDDNQKVIDELEAENQSLVKCCKEYDSRQRIDERIKANASKQLRATKRALWIARANRADDRARIFYFNDLETKLDIDGFSFDRKKKKGCKKMTAILWRIIWLKVERKCRAKAEEYR